MRMLNLTDDILDKLGFSGYRDGAGNYGTRTMVFDNGDSLRIMEHDQQDDGSQGYGEPVYVSEHFSYVHKNSPAHSEDLFFLHELYNCVIMWHGDSLIEFRKKCEFLNMGSYLPTHWTI